jgi:uncharacterized protein YndB with AHSA1/START domain
MTTMLTVKVDINASIQKVWDYFTTPQHIMQWNNANTDWHCPGATNTVKKEGQFCYTMAAKDGTMQFDFTGIFDEVLTEELLLITLGDNRKMKVSFASIGDVTEVVESFEPETQNSIELQQQGWQAILTSFKKYVEAN